MASKKENLPLVNEEKDIENGITYSTEVIATIAGVATSEVEGIAGMVNVGGIGDILGRNKNITKGVKVELGAEEVGIDVYVTVEYGTPIHKAACAIQENVRHALESMTGLTVVRVDVHVQGVSFEKDNANQPILTAANVAEKLKAPETVSANSKVELVDQDDAPISSKEE